MSLSLLSAVQTASECLLLALHVSVFVCICRQMLAAVALYSSAFFKIYLIRCLADYTAYILTCLLMRLMLAGLIPVPGLILSAVMSASIMFSVYLQLFLYACVVMNRYTAIVHPSRHGSVWSGTKLFGTITVFIFLSAIGAYIFERGNHFDGDDSSEDWKRQMVAISAFGITATVCLTSVALQARSIVVYHQMNKIAKSHIQEEFLLMGYTLLGMFMPVGLGLIFGLALFCGECSDPMVAFPYLVDYMSLCEPIWLLLTSKHLRKSYVGMYACCKTNTVPQSVIFVNPASAGRTGGAADKS